ncbi:FKBP12-associated protein [Hypoxylon texense]
MADSQASETPSNPRSRGRQPRGGRSFGSRGGRGGRRQRGQQGAERRQAPPADSTTPTASAATPSESRSGRGRRGPRIPRGSRRGGNEGGQRVMLGGLRTFGGHLTTNTETEESDSTTPAGLNIAVPAFVPGQPLAEHRTNSAIRPQAKVNTGRRASKSTAEDLPTRIHEDISNGHPAKFQGLVMLYMLDRNPHELRKQVVL